MSSGPRNSLIFYQVAAPHLKFLNSFLRKTQFKLVLNEINFLIKSDSRKTSFPIICFPRTCRFLLVTLLYNHSDVNLTWNFLTAKCSTTVSQKCWPARFVYFKTNDITLTSVLVLRLTKLWLNAFKRFVMAFYENSWSALGNTVVPA